MHPFFTGSGKHDTARTRPPERGKRKREREGGGANGAAFVTL